MDDSKLREIAQKVWPKPQYMIIEEQAGRIAELEQLLACEKNALDDEKAEHALTRAKNQRLRDALEIIAFTPLSIFALTYTARQALEGE